jgi:ribosome-binding factor A
MREIVASELERIGDERLEMVTITAVKVDGSLEHADVFYSAMSAEEEGRAEEVAEALDELRWPIQKLVNREVSTRKTPQIQFRPDLVLSSALRIEEILRGMSDRGELDETETEPQAETASEASEQEIVKESERETERRGE